MNREGVVYMQDALAGIIKETENGYNFTYDKCYLEKMDAIPVSLTLPLSKEPYVSNILFPFFDGLIPEGWLLNVATDNWKIDSLDRMGLLLKCCKECIGAVSVLPGQGKDI